MKNLQILNRSILKKAKKVAIIGNSGISPEDDEVIKESDIVIRFNNYATREGIKKTKDKFKCDILFSTFDLHSQGCRPLDVVIGIPFPFNSPKIREKMNRWYPHAGQWMVNPYENQRMCEELDLPLTQKFSNVDPDHNKILQGSCHPLPSIGFTALWHMQDWDVEFYISGFSWYYKDGKFQGWDLRDKDYPKIWNHNYPKEIIWIINNLLPKNNIMFSSESKRILEIAKSCI